MKKLILISVIAALSAFAQSGAHRDRGHGRDARDVNTPEPSTIVLTGFGIVGAAIAGTWAAKRRK